MAAPRRVLLVTDWMPEPGGSEGYAQRLVDGLRAAGDEVRLLTSSAGSAADGAADFVAFAPRNLAARALLQVANPFARRAVRQAIHTFRPDGVLVHLFAYHLSPAILAAMANVPTVMMVLDYKIVCPLGSKLLPDGKLCTERAGLVCWRSGCLGFGHWTREQVRYATIRSATSSLRVVLACSRHVQSVLAANGVEAAHVEMPVAAPSAGFTRRPAVHPTFVFSGRMTDEKGVTGLVRGFARLRQRAANARLHLVGDGPLRPSIESLVRSLGLEQDVEITGWVDSRGSGESARQRLGARRAVHLGRTLRTGRARSHRPGGARDCQPDRRVR